MRDPTDNEVMGHLIAIISDGFNRALGALERVGALDTRRMRSEYRGIGSKYYDLVTEEITLTASYGTAALRKLFSGEQPDVQDK